LKPTKIFTGIGTGIFMVILLACSQPRTKTNEKPVARVFEKYLYPSDLKDVIPSNISSADSSAMAKDFIEKWIRKQLLLNKAETNLSDKEKNVDKQIENYRSSLLIFKYEQNLIEQKLDTVITDPEIEKYYNDNSSNFLLNDNVVKALYIKIPKSSPNIRAVKRWYRSEKEEDQKQLEDYCYQYAAKYDNFNESWIYFSEILKAVPIEINNPENYLRYRKTIETEDGSFNYFVNIKEYKLIGEVAPLEFVSDNIRSIMLNKRKIQLIQKLESNIYNDELNRGNFNIY
jgi:hypothetical protein